MCDVVIVPTSQCPHRHFWIGLRRDESDITAPFKWQLPGGEEQELTYTNWCPGCPTNSQPKACVYAGPNANADKFIWDNEVCPTELCGVCEIDMYARFFLRHVAYDM